NPFFDIGQPTAIAVGQFDNDANQLPDLVIAGNGRTFLPNPRNGLVLFVNTSPPKNGQFIFTNPPIILPMPPAPAFYKELASGVVRASATPTTQEDIVALDQNNNNVYIYQNAGNPASGTAAFTLLAPINIAPLIPGGQANTRGLALANLVTGDPR